MREYSIREWFLQKANSVSSGVIVTHGDEVPG
jgi:hypothetical protein